MAPLTDDDQVLIRILRTDKGFDAFQMIKEFPNRGSNKNTLNRLIRKIDETGTSRRKPRESVRTARTPANIARVSLLQHVVDILNIHLIRKDCNRLSPN